MGDAEHHEEKQHRWGWENATVGGVCVVCAAHCLIEGDARIVNFEGRLEGREWASGTPGSNWLSLWG